MRWVAGSGRPASVLNDKLLIDWVHDLSNGSYRPPERKFAGASGPLATIDVKLLKENIDGEPLAPGDVDARAHPLGPRLREEHRLL